MADLGEIVEELRSDEDRRSGHEDGGDSPQRNSKTKRRRLRKWRNSGDPGVPARENLTLRVIDEAQETDVQEQDISPVREDYESQFYETYRKVAEEYDKEFFKKYDEDLNTTLIFAGLFSAVASAFIIEVDSQLQFSPNADTAALLRVLLYKIDNTTFGGGVPVLPQWDGPSPTMVRVQAILFASLATALFSAFIAMLGKQWLNRYASSDMRGSAVERSQNRQRKLDGIVAWSFNNVMESLPLMLQASLLLLGCALSLYLWDINVIVAWVALGTTLSGVFFYAFIVIAGAASESCPYQTPVSRILRSLKKTLSRKPHPCASVLKRIFKKSDVVCSIAHAISSYRPWWSGRNIMRFSKDLVFTIPLAFVTDAYRLGVHAWMRVMRFALRRRAHRRATTLDLRCISWTLRTSLDKSVRLSTLKHLLTLEDSTSFDPTLVLDCFNIFAGSVSFSNGKLVALRGLDQLATVAAGCFLHTFHRLLAARPASNVLLDIRRRYNAAFSPEGGPRNTPYYDASVVTRFLFEEEWMSPNIRSEGSKPSTLERSWLARYMVTAAQVGYKHTQRKKVPRWILRFVLHPWTLDPPPPPSVIADCLTIIGVDLGCDVPNAVISNEGARIGKISDIITQRLTIMTDTLDLPSVASKYSKAISALIPYAVLLEQRGQQGMLNAILNIAKVSNPQHGRFMWRHIEPYIAKLFDKSSSYSLDQAIIHLSPYAPWEEDLCTEEAVVRWSEAVSRVAYTEEVGQKVVDVLFQIAEIHQLRPHIPMDVWVWLKRQPTLPPVCRGRLSGSWGDVVHHVQGFGDVKMLKSFFIVIWSEWDYLFSPISNITAIREEFSGIQMGDIRKELLGRLECVLRELEREEREPGYLRQGDPKATSDYVGVAKSHYELLKETLLELDKGAMEELVRGYHSTFSCALPLP